MINLSNVLRPGGPFSQPFTIQRAAAGAFVAGGYTQTRTPIPVVGAVVVAKERELQQLAEADRVTGAMMFYSTVELKITRGGVNPGNSDLITWRGDTYRLAKLWPWADYGFWKAAGVRVSGQ